MNAHKITLKWTKETPEALVQTMPTRRDGDDDNLRFLLNKGMLKRYFDIVHKGWEEAGSNKLPMNGRAPVHTGGTITWYVDSDTNTVTFMAEGMQQTAAIPTRQTSGASTQHVAYHDDDGGGGGGGGGSAGGGSSSSSGSQAALAKQVAPANDHVQADAAERLRLTEARGTEMTALKAHHATAQARAQAKAETAIKAGLARLCNHRTMLEQIMLCVGIFIVCSAVSSAAPIIMPMLAVGAFVSKADVVLNVCKVIAVARVAHIAWKEGCLTPLWNSITKNWKRLKQVLGFVYVIAKMLGIAKMIEWLVDSGGWWGQILTLVLFVVALFVASQLYSMVTSSLMLLLMWGYSEKVLADAEEDFNNCCNAAVSSDEATNTTGDEDHAKSE
jgi:hypothetical protein